MGVFVKFSEFVGKEIGEITEPQGRLANRVADAMCEVWNEYPGNWKTAENVVAGYQRGFMGALCGGNAPPPPPQLPECQLPVMLWGTFRRAFKVGDGECGDTGYWRATIVGGEEQIGSTQPVNIDGKMYIVQEDGTERGCSPSNKSIYDNEFYGSPNTALRFVDFKPDCTNGTLDSGGDRFSFTKKTYQGELPEYCEQGGAYPEVDAPDQVTKTITINFGDNNSENYTATFSTVNNNFQFPTTVNVGGVTVKVGFGGISIGGDDVGDVAPAPEPPGGTVTKFLPNPDDKDYIVEPPPDIEEEEEIEDVEVEDEEIDWVLITVTSPPKKGKTILHPNPENNTFFAGYFAWVINDGDSYWLAEQPIRKTRNAFKAPENISGYRAYTVNDAKIQIRQYTQIIEAEE